MLEKEVPAMPSMYWMGGIWTTLASLKPPDISDESITFQRSATNRETHAREKFREVK
eukprot:SAG31_NODE_47511_length_238_cov_77.143885_1_plen_56_part_10